jgi:hypothetical protein
MQESMPEIKTELAAFMEKGRISDYDNFLFDVRQYQHNQNSTTSMPLIGKTVETLESKSVKRLLSQKPVKEHLAIHKVKKDDPLTNKLKSLNLMTNGLVPCKR